MLFNSLDFLIFFPVVVLVYFVLPYRVRNMWLLVASYYFYMGWDPKYALLIAVSTATTWGTGLLLEWFGRDDSTGLQRKLLLAVCLVFNHNEPRHGVPAPRYQLSGAGFRRGVASGYFLLYFSGLGLCN